jgi:hypothetical protein
LDVWSSICRRLAYPIDLKGFDAGGRFVIERVADQEAAETKEVLAHLRSKCDGNVHDKGVVFITSSRDRRNHCWQVTDPKWTGC